MNKKLYAIRTEEDAKGDLSFIDFLGREEFIGHEAYHAILIAEQEIPIRDRELICGEIKHEIRAGGFKVDFINAFPWLPYDWYNTDDENLIFLNRAHALLTVLKTKELNGRASEMFVNAIKKVSRRLGALVEIIVKALITAINFIRGLISDKRIDDANKDDITLLTTITKAIHKKYTAIYSEFDNSIPEETKREYIAMNEAYVNRRVEKDLNFFTRVLYRQANSFHYAKS